MNYAGGYTSQSVTRNKTQTRYEFPLSGFTNKGEATIYCVMDVNPLNGSLYHKGFKWEGDPTLLVKIDKNCEHFIADMPWCLEKLKSPYRWGLTNIYIRTDNAYSYAYHRFHQDWWNMIYALRHMGHLLILTAMVWGWAYVPPGDRPQRKHLGRDKYLKKFGKKHK